MKKVINGYRYDTKGAKKLASCSWDNFPEKGDFMSSELFQDSEGKYFVLEQYSWFKDKMIIPKDRMEAEFYYLLYAKDNFEDF